MKLPCILITVAFLNVSPIMTDDLANSVYITKEHIREAFIKDKAGLHTVFRNIIDGDKPIDQVNELLAVTGSIVIEEELQRTITDVTKIPVPQLGPDKEYSKDDLEWLGVERRLYPKIFTESLLQDAIIKTKTAPASVNFTYVCRLTGLVKCMNFPNQCIRTTEVDSDGICKLTTSDGNVTKYKRNPNGHIYTEEPNNTTRPKLLLEQIPSWKMQYSEKSNRLWGGRF